MAKEKERTWKEISQEAELWTGRLVRPVSINITAQGKAILSRIATECQEKDKAEKAQGKKITESEIFWKKTALEYAKVNQEKVVSRNVTQTAGYNADLRRLGKDVKNEVKND